MNAADVLRLRLSSQGLARAAFRKPEDVVSWFGAVQAQDYLGALWAIGQRLRNATEAKIEAAEARRAIVRLWPMRGTLHFVAADDVRWITQLLAPRVLARNAARLKREVEVDSRVVARCRGVVRRALEGGRRLDRKDLYAALEARRIRTDGSRGLHILGWLAMEGTLCLAGRSGKQHTFALLDEWIPKSTKLDRDAGLAELARRYFSSHGPATRRDFMWWAGITAKDAQAAIDATHASLSRALVDGDEYWWREAGARQSVVRAPLVRLLPAFDEYTVAYHDRTLIADARLPKMSLLSPAVMVNGRIIGNWTRRLERNRAVIAANLREKLSRAESLELKAALSSYGRFMGLEAVLDQ